MTTIAATDAKNRFGELLETVYREPVEISKKGRAVAVVLSIEEYEDMTKKLGQLEKPTDFSGIEAWINRTQQSRRGKPLDEADYYRRLDEKYGS